MNNTWTIDDFTAAMRSAVESNACLKKIHNHEKLIFNGFWRNGKKPNVCLWLDKATWHDAKTGEGGGCKEFAKVAFNMGLQEFMSGYGAARIDMPKIAKKKIVKNIVNPTSMIPVDKLWEALVKAESNHQDDAAKWLSHTRKFLSPRKILGSGFANITKDCLHQFGPAHAGFIQQRLEIGLQMAVPIRGVHSDKERNLFLRTISDVSKDQKSRLLPGAQGWSEEDGSPRAFGFPWLIHDFPNLVICEGMADYFAAECILYGEEKYLPIGAPSASALVKWAQWLAQEQYKGRVIWIYQLDINEQGKVVSSGIGQSQAVSASKVLKTNGIRSELFNWPYFLKKLTSLKQVPKDLADIYSAYENQDELQELFLSLYSGC